MPENNLQQQLAEAYADASAHMDAEGVPEDSLFRGLVLVTLACNQNPILQSLMETLWPSPASLLQ